jgi:hypothetical protein
MAQTKTFVIKNECLSENFTDVLLLEWKKKVFFND